MSTLFVALLSEEFDQKLLDIEDVSKENPTLAIVAKVGSLFFRIEQGQEYMISYDRQIGLLAYEKSSESRCTYLLPVAQYSWNESIEKIYDFFASNEVNKHQLMASSLVDLRLPCNYEYQRILHSDYLFWVDN